MKKLILFLFLSLSLKAFTQKIDWIPIEWVNYQGLEKAGIFIPVKIDNLPYKFKMQFDLGAITTIIYSNSFRPYLEKHKDFQNKLDTTKQFTIQGEVNNMFHPVTLQLSNTFFRDIPVGLYENFGETYPNEIVNDTETQHLIGTIAVDIIKNKVLVLDYKNDRLAICDQLPNEYKHTDFVKFDNTYGHIILPIQINGKEKFVAFDTGASLMPLFTSKKNALEISNGTVIDSLRLTSWEVEDTYYKLQTNVPVLLGQKDLDLKNVFYETSGKMDEAFEDDELWGIMGNALFLNSVLIVDYKEQRIGLIE